MRHFAVIGMSSFGYYLCKFMAERGFYVLAIDNDEVKINRVKDFVQKAVIADATDKETLERLGLGDFDGVVVSLGDRIDASILVTLYLRQLGVDEIIAKAITEDHGKILDLIGATTVLFPEKDMAYRLAHSLDNVNVLDYIPLTSDVSIIEMAPPSSFLGKTLAELDLRRKYHVQVLMIKELVPENVVVIPTGDHVIKDSDVLVVMGKDEDLKRLESLK
ncbi:MAG TPA: TrkA family potassium uptake protein [Bacteroidetes bacterium]|nr:TrkA family potassium uptake protein [Calditrichota bacterium]HFE53276.1 TrkA family potassium uptake protein [Bacteroidota bacterium]